MSEVNTVARSDSIVNVENLSKWYAADQGILSQFRSKKYLKAVDDVSFSIDSSEIIGLAGQSGCGKSTLGELLVGLQNPTKGSIYFDGDDITKYNSKEMKQFRRRCQVIFQDPYESLNPRFPVLRIVTEPLTIHSIGDREEREDRAIQALADAGLTPPEKFIDKFPDELSGGERQRVSIARAIVLEPDFLVADEPVSMLDVSIRTGILKLFKKFQREKDMTILFVSHDLSTINYLCDRTMIMYMGDVVEVGSTSDVIHRPSHPYTDSLLQSVPNTENSEQHDVAEGDVPDPVEMPDGCRYHPRCKFATEKCKETEPQLNPESDNVSRRVACYHPIDQ